MAKKYTRLEWERIMNSLPPEDREPYEQSPDVDTQTPEGDTPTTDKYETDEQGVLTKNGVPFTGTYDGKNYKDGKVVEAPKGDTADDKIESIREKLGIGEALLKSKWAGKEGEGQLFDVFALWNQKKYTAAQELFYKTKFGKLSNASQDRELLKLEESKEYDNALASWKNTIRELLRSNNLTVDETKLEDYYLSGIADEVILDEAYSASPDAANRGALQQLQQAAKDNGIDLATEFGTEVDTWLKQIFDKAPINTFLQKIRDAAAKKTTNSYIKDKLAAGQNLKELYKPFIDAMVKSFGVSPDTIELTDPLLTTVFAGNKPMSTNDFITKLKADPRYRAGVPQETLDKWLNDTRTVLSARGFRGAFTDKELQDFYFKGITSPDDIAREAYLKARGATGPDAEALRALTRVAQDNNIDLNTEFKAELDGWLQDIYNGRPIGEIAQLIRNRAAEGIEDKFIKGLVLDGQNLRNVYDRYINIMANAFNIADPRSIDLNDPLLKQAFKDGKAMNLTDFEYLVKNDTRFKTGLGKFNVASTKAEIEQYALREGFTLDDQSVEDLLNNILAMGLPVNSPYVQNLIRAKFTYSPGVALGGLAGNRLAELRNTAAANGLDLDAQFGSQLQGWLKRISQGEDVETFNRIIRQAAAFGRPANVASLMNLGVNLETILQPYKNTIASELGINPTSILNTDPLLNKAFGEKGELSIGDYRTLVRQDPRFQYTPKAYEETYNAGMKILQDFGFQG